MVRSIFKPLLLVLFAWYSCAQSGLASEQNKKSEQLERIYAYSQIENVFAWVREQVRQDVAEQRLHCTDSQQLTLNENLLDTFSAPNTLQSAFITEIDKRLNASETSMLDDWIKTTTAKVVAAAEAAPQIAEQEYNEQLNRYLESPLLTKERKLLSSQIVKESGAVYFYSALSTGIDAVITMASVCDNQPRTIQAAQKRIDEERGAEALYRSFLHTDMFREATFTYRNVEMKELKNYLDFIEADAGRAYHAAMIQGLRTVLAAQVDDLKQQLGP